MSEQITDEREPETDQPAHEYRLSHLQEDIASAFADRDATQLIAPLGRGGVGQRVSNRARFQVSDTDRLRFVEDTLTTEGFAWTTTDEPGEYVILGRRIPDLRTLRNGDRIHLNKRGGPFSVYRATEQATGPEVLQRSAPSVTVDVSNEESGTDWMVVHWQNEKQPWAYVRTKDKNASGNYRYRKVETVERCGRIGPRRLFTPDSDRTTEGYQSMIRERVENAADSGWIDTHPSDVDRTLSLMANPPVDVFSPEDADTVRGVLSDVADAHEREGNARAMAIAEDETNRGLAEELQADARTLDELTNAFALLEMDAVEPGGQVSIYRHEPCGMSFTDRYAYSTHCRMCDADDGETGNTEDTNDDH